MEELKSVLYDLELFGKYEKDFIITGNSESHSIRFGTLTVEEYFNCLMKTSNLSSDSIARQILLDNEVLAISIISVDGVEIENEIQREYLRQWINKLSLPIRQKLLDAYGVLQIEQATVIEEKLEKEDIKSPIEQLKQLKNE